MKQKLQKATKPVVSLLQPILLLTFIMCRDRLLYTTFTTTLIVGLQLMLHAQNDSLQRFRVDSFLLNQKGVVGKLAQNLLVDTAGEAKGPQSNDKAFQRYRGRIIRHIIIKTIDFGVSFGDTTKRLNNKLTHIANDLHLKTKEEVIYKNLFFKEKDTLSPFLLGDNERYLRDLPYLQNAKITVQPVKGQRDSVDVVVLTKDVISVGGSFELHNPTSAAITLKEDNFYGLGDRLLLQTLYDQERHQHFGYGFEYIKRNIKGTFIDGAAGYLNFQGTFNNGNREERTAYIQFVKPLVNPYIHWTYALEARLNASMNMYHTDSFYNTNLKYRYSTVDAWGAWSTSAGHIAGRNADRRLRALFGFRFLNQHFTDKPLRYRQEYFYQYANLTAVLGSLSLYQQNFYKEYYLYGFGRPEDVPQGVDATLTSGWTMKDSRKRPYMAVDLRRFFFTPAGRYFDFTFRAGSFFYKQHAEDINLLATVSFFNYLHNINGRWKQRTFINASIAKQFRTLLNEPVMPYKLYGRLNNFINNFIPGDWRMGINAESVFFSPWSVFYFHIAPFVAGDVSLFRFEIDHSSDINIYTAIGGGFRVRNESLVFGTMEVRGWYFPRKNFYNERFKIEFRTNVRFTYNQNFIRRPEFVQIN